MPVSPVIPGYELRRICRKLHTLDEMACNGEIQDPDDTDTWYRYNPDQYGTPTKQGNKLRTQPQDLLRTAETLVRSHGFRAYHQGDPRGCSLYVYKPEDLERCSRGSEPGIRYFCLLQPDRHRYLLNSRPSSVASLPRNGGAIFMAVAWRDWLSTTRGLSLYFSSSKMLLSKLQSLGNNSFLATIAARRC